MTIAIKMSKHRQARFGLHAGHQPLAAAGNDHVDRAVKTGQHQAHGIAIPGRHQLNRGLGHAGAGEARRDSGVNGA
jgi:hypothetical protein